MRRKDIKEFERALLHTEKACAILEELENTLQRKRPEWFAGGYKISDRIGEHLRWINGRNQSMRSDLKMLKGE